MRNILHFFLDIIDIYYKKVIVATLSLLFPALKTSLMILVFFINLGLIDKRLLEALPTTYVSMERVSRFILPRVFILFFSWPIPLEILGINLLGT